MTANPYEELADAGNGVILYDSMLVFIDSLGTRDAMKVTDVEELNRRFLTFRTAWMEASGASGLKEDGRDYPIMSPLGLASFSDNIVAALPVPPGTDGESEFGYLVGGASWFQLLLALEGIFVRGGLVRELAWVGSDLAYGPALTLAYELETSTAVYPRIVVDAGLRNDLTRYVSYYGGDGSSPEEAQLLVDADGTMFINYLDIASDHPDKNEGAKVLGRHREAVASKLFDTRSQARVHDKFLWLARYHNHVVATRWDDDESLKVRSPPDEFTFVSLGAHLAPDR